MKVFLWCAALGFLVVGLPLFGQQTVVIKATGVEGGPTTYLQAIITQALIADGYKVELKLPGEFTGVRNEAMLLEGVINVSILGETPERNAKFLPVKVGMNNNISGKRLLFIPKGSQKDYDGVKTLADFQKLGKVAGMGKNWADMGIWAANKLPAKGIDGDWKVIYKMVESKSRGVDYLPRGANEMIAEIKEYTFLDLERNLVLVYQKDQILYVSPKEPQLQPILEKALKKAQASGLIKKLVNQFNQAAFEPPIDVDSRTVINLVVP